MNHIQHFVIWMIKRILKIVCYTPKVLHEYFVYNLQRNTIAALAGFGFAYVAGVILSVGFFLATGVPKAQGEPLIVDFGIVCVAYLIACIIQVQHRIYCREVSRTMEKLRSQDKDDFDF